MRSIGSEHAGIAFASGGCGGAGAGVLVTGALHEDGLADVADGFGGGHTGEQRLDIMRDSHIGTYGTTTPFALPSLIRAAIYETLSGAEPTHILALLASAAAFSRSLVVDLFGHAASARDGLSVFAGRPGKLSALFSLLTGGIAPPSQVGLVLSAEIAVIAIIAAASCCPFCGGSPCAKSAGRPRRLRRGPGADELAMLTFYAATLLTLEPIVANQFQYLLRMRRPI